ncbi:MULTISPECIES: hypothetical protein [Yersinia]|nr:MULTISPECIES: hypothetical protein [Yersinia]MDA5546128.1 hypothetical protein [Yersinia rochesterensis]UZM74505.1 hypothetical protein OP863_16445 [Yersinia sp. SCPM-O-B-9106 (C-191)]
MDIESLIAAANRAQQAGSKDMQLSLQKITVWEASSTLILSKYSG